VPVTRILPTADCLYDPCIRLTQELDIRYIARGPAIHISPAIMLDWFCLSNAVNDIGEITLECM